MCILPPSSGRIASIIALLMAAIHTPETSMYCHKTTLRYIQKAVIFIPAAVRT
jgi:hypothetical protein